MSIAKNYPVITNDDDVHIGDGYMFLGDANTDYDETAIYSVGCIRGTSTFTPIIETAQLKAGSPRALTIVEPQEVGCSLKVTFVELNAVRLSKIFGMGTVTDKATSTPSVTDEQVYLYNNYFMRLIGSNISDAPAPTVTDGEASPTEYTEGVDYEIDYDNGLIRRILTGSIADGQKVYVSYTYSRKAYKELKMGVETSINTYPLLYVVPMKNQGRIKIKIWKAVPTEFGELPFQSDEFSQIDVTFSALADRTKSPDNMFYNIDWEYSA